MAATTYWTVFGWAVVAAAAILCAAALASLLLDKLGRQVMLHLFGPIVGFFAVCALVALPIWWLT